MSVSAFILIRLKVPSSYQPRDTRRDLTPCFFLRAMTIQQLNIQHRPARAQTSDPCKDCKTGPMRHKSVAKKIWKPPFFGSWSPVGTESLPCFYSILKIYNFRYIVHFLKRILQVVDNAAFWQNVLLYFENEFLDVFYCGHVTYQIWAWFETFKENINRTNTVDFQYPLDFRSQKRRFEISLATDLYSCCS